MDSVGVIPARFGSTRFPGKPLKMIAGETLIARVVKGALGSSRLKTILVATDDERIAAEAEKAGARAVMTDSDLPSGSDRVWAALKVAGLENADVVLNIQGDEPLITGEPLDQLISAFDCRPELDMATLGRPFDMATPAGREALASGTTAKIVLDQTGRALYFSRFPIPFSRVPADAMGPEWQAQLSTVVLKHIGIYAYRPRFLERFCAAPPAGLEVFEGLEQLRALALGARIQVVQTQHESWGVDTPEDVEKIERMLAATR
ncbi:MAG: 3-deoxy-manno-octulosonate cytidylyltransferase [Bdellovibrionales bacterium]|nr:3-deoxy-manno-octulosonate cytidylyltransferase [Bdellovibrionales bacterium]